MDPYEQQLLTVFNTYDLDNCGSLDEKGLTQLCQTLQLEEQAPDLIQCLLKLKEPQNKQPRATFPQFKDALLTLLGNMQRSNTSTNNPLMKQQGGDGSPDREVSPKFVYGSKKYGRRSRPRSDEILANNDEGDEGRDYVNNKGVAVQRSNSQSEVAATKKRKTNYKLKRCTSLPSNNNNNRNNLVLLNSDCICTEEMLREAWKKLGVGDDGFLNQSELVLVCDAIGLHKLAKGVIKQLANVDCDYKISFQELLEVLQRDETWSDVLVTDSVNHSDSFPDSRTFHFVTLGPDGSGLIHAENLIEMWETVGITSPKELIHELGFSNREISIVDLAAVLDKEIRGIYDQSSQNHHVALLQANLTLYQSEIKCLKNILEQLHCEREKLKCDVSEANNRAKLLAQEVDDNHLKMERNTQNQVKLLEQRHSDILRDLTQNFGQEKEQLSHSNQSLEMKIAALESEVGKLKNDLVVAQKYSTSLERENHSLNSQICELQQVKNLLADQISSLENDKQKYAEMEQKQIEPLLSKLSNLQLENSQLRDKNDEMCSEIENLTCQVAAMRSKVNATPTYPSVTSTTNTLDQSMEDDEDDDDDDDDEDEEVVEENLVGLGAKRRSRRFKDNRLFDLVDSSPRLGKVRKFHQNAEDKRDTAGGDVAKLHAKVAFLEQLLAHHNIPFGSSQGEEDGLEGEGSLHHHHYSDLESRLHHLEKIFTGLSEIKKMITVKNGLTTNALQQVGNGLKDIITSATSSTAVENKLVDVGMETDPDFESVVRGYEEENNALRTKCAELESCVDLLRNEYEKCEDYWQCKLEEERQMFEQEQSQSSDKLTDLINKMAEYEEQFASQDQVDNRLPTIDETYNLEKQFTDMEQEFEEYKTQTESQIVQRDREIELLKQKLTELALRSSTNDIGIQVSSKGTTNLSMCVVESTNLFSADAMPPCWQQQQPDKNFVWNKEMSATVTTSQASSSNSSTLDKSLDTPCRPKRTRKHDRSTLIYQKKTGTTSNQNGVVKEQQMVALPIGTIHGLNGRLHHLEQRCRQLQMVLRQQHFYTEQTLQQCRQHHRGEKAELHSFLRSQQDKLEQQVRICNEQLERLTRSDMLVKELYVENSYLIAKVQRLEQQCHLLTQCNSNSSSV